jgi:uncharacterized UPF0160 family protein
MLRQTDEFRDAEIIRTRDPAVIDSQSIVVDVGGVYDPARHRYDHHQREFQGTFSPKHFTKLSSAGLIYKHFGREIIKKALNTDEANTETLFFRIYEAFIEAVDGIDNGVERYPSDVKPKYRSSTELSSRVSYLNPAWNDPHPDIEGGFKKAVELTGKEFMERVNYFGKVWLPARSIVEDALKTRMSVDSSGEILLFERFCPWKEHLSDLEEELKLQEDIKYVLFEDTSGSWRVQCVTKNGSTFENRLSLPEPWRGFRDQELSNISGIDGCIFVHATGFIGGNKTRAGALEMARKALRIALEKNTVEF